MDHEAAEKWIANLILNARLNAKIDSQSGMAREAGEGGAAVRRQGKGAKGARERTMDWPQVPVTSCYAVGCVAREEGSK